MCSQLKLFCHFPSAVCQQKERTFGTRSLSAESWQSCWTIRRACLTQRTMMSPPPMTTAPSMNRFDPSLLYHTSQYGCFCLAYWKSVSNNMTIISIAHFLHLISQMLLSLLMTVNGEDIVNIFSAVMAKHFITVHREVVYFWAYSLMQLLVFLAHTCLPSCCNRLFSPWDQ